MVKEEDRTLKFLGFIQVAALNAVIWFFNIYDFAKDNSGPFETIIEFVEGMVETTVGPLYDKFYDVPIEVLKFVDLKIDEYVDSQVPQVIKAAVSEVKRVGVVDAILTPAAEHFAMKTLAELNRVPLLAQVAKVLLPTVGYCLEKYNETVSSTAEKGYKVSTYLPLVPTEKIAKVLGADAAVRAWHSFFRSPGIRFSIFMI